jgi:hypothetical protein
VIMDHLRRQGYGGGITILKDYLANWGIGRDRQGVSVGPRRPLPVTP